MTSHDLCAHHVGGRAGTVAFPKIAPFAASVYNVIYDADESCVSEIEHQWSGSKVLPYCLADGKRQATFHLNFCGFTNSMFPFNEAFGNYYEEKRLNYSDYVFGKTFQTQREVMLSTESIDGLFAKHQIPQVDFLSLDAQGAELMILHGATDMLTATTVAVSCEVSFVELYQGVPLFGEVDAYLRSKGFLLAELAPMAFGYKRIPRAFRGRGMPLQGEALYFIKPATITNEAPVIRRQRLDKLAFCALAFGYTELAFEACELSASLPVADAGPFRGFLTRFQAEVSRSSRLPPLWHESLDLPVASPAGGPFPVRLLERLAADPKLFAVDLRRVLTKRLVTALRFLKLPGLAFNRFERFLAAAGFDQAANAVCQRRVG